MKTCCGDAETKLIAFATGAATLTVVATAVAPAVLAAKVVGPLQGDPSAWTAV
jgi:hypothetical protein